MRLFCLFKTPWFFFFLQLIISLIEKSTGKLHTMTYECGPFFFFHVINCYQKSAAAKTLILDVMAYKNADVIKDLRFCQIEKTDHIPSARAVRLILPLGPQFTTKVHTCARLREGPDYPPPVGQNFGFIPPLSKPRSRHLSPLSQTPGLDISPLSQRR